MARRRTFAVRKTYATAKRPELATLLPDCNALLALETPALVLDGEALELNVERMAAAARQSGVALRPHAKTHKSNDIAVLQIRAGAVGISCATIAEAEALAVAGIGGLLITSPMMGTEKFSRVAKLNRTTNLTVAVDHVAQVKELLAALQPGDRKLRVVVDVDVGQARTGVNDLAVGVDLARMIAQRPQLEFAGIQGFAGHAQHIIDPVERKAVSAQAAATLSSFAKALADTDLPPSLITGSGTGTYSLDTGGPYNELQVGSYVFMDADYARIKDDKGQGLSFSASLFVLATVVSVNRSGQVTVDAGTKALATNGPLPCHIIGAGRGATYKFAGDEHGIITILAGEQSPDLGARVLIGATHCDPTVNLHASFHVLKNGAVRKWLIRGRYGE
jgi:D-serine deaminase-like pyridoxal phosphate-dependent protein